MQPSDAKLWLDPDTVIVPAKGWLHVLNRTGLTKIQADQIDEVHKKLKPYLDGTCREDELFSAVAAEKRSVLEKYFAAMTQAGALHRGESPPETTRMAVQDANHHQAASTLVVSVNGKRVFVSLDGEDLPADAGNHGYDASLFFVSPKQMNTQWTHIWRAHKNGPHLLYVIEERKPEVPVNRADVAARKQYAAWLIGCSRIDLWQSRTFRLYTLDRGRSVLAPIFQARFSQDNPDGKTLVAGITPDLITVTDHNQVPLVIAKAAVPFFPVSVAGCGLDYGLLSEELGREFMVQAALACENHTVPCIIEVKHCERSRATLGRTRVDRNQAATWPVAGSLLHLRVRALEQFCRDLSRSAGQVSAHEIDLLQFADRHPQIALLANMLRTRLRTLPGSIQTTDYGLYVWQSGNHQAHALIEAKAIRDVLLAVAKDEFYGESLNGISARHECGFATFLADNELEQIARRQNDLLDQRRINRKFTFKHVQRFGLSAWTGIVSHAD